MTAFPERVIGQHQPGRVLAIDVQSRTRNLWLYAALTIGVMVAGLASRRYSADLPRTVSDYAGDTLWALMVFLGLGIVRPSGATWRLAAAALAIAWADEISQLYHPAWAAAVRHTTIGALILGDVFVWTDLVCYTAGVGVGACAEYLADRWRRPARA
jgi:hypothetical protein